VDPIAAMIRSGVRTARESAEESAKVEMDGADMIKNTDGSASIQHLTSAYQLRIGWSKLRFLDAVGQHLGVDMSTQVVMGHKHRSSSRLPPDQYSKILECTQRHPATGPSFSTLSQEAVATITHEHGGKTIMRFSADPWGKNLRFFRIRLRKRR